MVRSSYIIIVSGWEMTSQFWVQWSRFWMQWVTVVFDDVFFTSLWSDHHISSLYLVWEMTCQFWVQWWHFLTVKGNCCFWWCFYTSYINILSGMGDDVSILGAVVTFFGGDGLMLFLWCFYTWVRLDHHKSSLYLVREMTCQFLVQWSHFLEVMGFCCFF